ncbi:MAG: NRDE family protein [Woeseia sp.]
MCLVVFAWRAHAQYRLILAGNRDESHRRPTRDAHWWADRQSILAGRDLQAGGTWLALGRSGRFATVTNFRERQRSNARLESRGRLVTDFVAGSLSPREFGSMLVGEDYAGFSLLMCDGESMYYLSNRDDLEADLAPGIYGLANASIDTPWSKVLRSKTVLESLIENDAVNETGLMRLLSDRTPAPVEDVAPKDLPFEIARALTAPFIVAPDYGTRSSTTVLWGNDDAVEFCERRFLPSGKPSGDSRFRFQVE